MYQSMRTIKHITPFLFCSVLAFLLPVWSGESETSDQKTVLVIYRPGPNWVDGKPVTAQTPKEHGKYMLSLYKKGTLKFAGPFTDDAGGAVVLNVADVFEAQKIAAEDPAVQTGVFIAEIHPWFMVPWEKYLAREN